MRRVLHRVALGSVALVSMSACVMLVGIDDVTLLDEGIGGDGGQAGGGGPVAAGGTSGIGGGGHGGGDGGDGGDGGCSSATPCSNGEPCVGHVDCISGHCGAGATCQPWVRSFGKDDEDQLARRAAIDGEGNIVVTGYFQGEVDFGSGSAVASGQEEDLFVVKIDRTGVVLWDNIYAAAASSLDDRGHGVAVDAGGNIYVVGEHQGTINFGGNDLVASGSVDGFVLKLDPLGNHVWSRPLTGGGTDRAYAVAVDPQGAIVISGHTYSNDLALGGDCMPVATNGGSDVFAAKLQQSDGACDWIQSWGGSGAAEEASYDLAVDNAGHVIVMGHCAGAYSIGGLDHMTAMDSFDVCLGKLNGATGAPLWSDNFGGSASDFALSVTVGPLDSFIVTGNTSSAVMDFSDGMDPLSLGGTTDAWIASFDAAGAHRWSRSFGQNGDTSLRGVVAGDNGVITASGCFAGATLEIDGTMLDNAAAGTSDVFVVRLDGSGAGASVAPAIRYGGGGEDSPLDLWRSPHTSNLVSIGVFTTSIALGAANPAIGAGSGYDLYVASLGDAPVP